MRLLICTQIVDKNDPILGFFHGWIIEFAKHFEQIYVICLQEGVHDLPKNVEVFSLGKEKGVNFIKYIYKFYKYIFLLRGSYTRVFVHMNPHYIMLGGILWKCMGVPIFFWRNHAKMNLMTQIAAKFARGIFYTSPFACTSVFSHARRMPVGINTEIFFPRPRTDTGESLPKKILFLGRLSPVKRIELFIETAKLSSSSYEFHIYGDDPTKQQEYLHALHTRASGNTNIFFHPAVINVETPEIYSACDLYINLTPEGSMDKTVLEAAACGVTVLVSNSSFSDIFSDTSLLNEVTPQGILQKMTILFSLTPDIKKQHSVEARKRVVENHSLQKLGTEIYHCML